MQSIDLRGVRCPTNFVKAKLAIEMADVGDHMRFYLDEGEPIENVSRSLEGEGHKVISLKQADGYCVLEVEIT